MLIYACPWLAILIFTSCGLGHKGEERSPVERRIIQGIASPVRASMDHTTVELGDYIDSDVQVDSVLMFGETLEYNGSEVHIHSWDSDMAMANMQLWSQGREYIIPVFRSKKSRYTFTFDAQGGDFSSVKLKGEMCAWNPDALEFEMENGVYRTEMTLSPGSYQYIMVIDGQETLDYNNPEKVENGLGGYNSLLVHGDLDKEELILHAGLDGNEIVLGPSYKAELLVLWNNQLLTPYQEGNTWRVEIPKAAGAYDRSFLRAWAFDDAKVSNDILIPLSNGFVVQNVNALDRHDKHAMRLYNVFVDRFHNGDPQNDRPIASPEVHPRADDHGGDIRGLIDKLEVGFFDSLNINTIWISPIVKNVEGAWGKWPEPETEFSAYHGYWPVSFTLIDDRKGRAAELHELVEKAHAQGMNVLLDFVANHVHESHPFYKEHPEYATDLYLPDGRLNTELWDEQRLTTWFDVFLPTLKLDEPAVYEMLTDSAVFWIKEYDLDGFRHDATKHVPEVFWKTLTHKLKEQVISKGKPLFQIGETYGTSELIASYVNTGQLDAQFDFNVYDAIVSTLCRDQVGFDRLDDEIHASLDTYGHHHLMGNITGNQDRGRFISYAGGALRFDENSKKAGWTREIGVGNDDAYDKSTLLMALTATIPGIPVIYNGDEIGSYGGNDPDNRKMMRFDSLSEQETMLRQETQNLMSIREESIPLIYGDFRTHVLEDDVYVYSRNYLGQSIIVLINNSNLTRSATFTLENDQSLSWKVGYQRSEDSKEQGKPNFSGDSS